MLQEPSYEVRTSKKYHDLCEKLCEKHCYKDGAMWKLPREKIKEVPQEELYVMFKYPPIEIFYIDPNKSKYNRKSKKYDIY